MNWKWHNVLGFIGTSMIGASLWAIHPAMTVGFAGVIVLTCGVWMARQQTIVPNNSKESA